jgi:radical SAM protein with 4Fe4S-binding SPASM domain
MFYIDEIILGNLIRSLTLRRTFNLLKTSASFLLSAITGQNILWGRPSILTIEPTNICNLRCPLCATGSGDMQRSNGKMTLETFTKLMELAAGDIFFLILYHQGEPYINKHFLDFVRLAKSHNIYCTTSTNAHYFDDDAINDTIDSGLDSMIISMDGVTQETYEQYRVKGNLEKVIRSLRRFSDIKERRHSKTPLLALQFLVMKHNERELPQLRKLAREIGVDRLLIKNIEVHTSEEAAVWLPENEKYRRYNFSEERLEVKNSNKKSCPRPWLSALVNWDGSVVPCCFDKNGGYNMGNIHTAKELDDIWRGNLFSSFRRRLSADRRSIDMCRNCNQGLGSFIPDISLRKAPDNNRTGKPESSPEAALRITK